MKVYFANFKISRYREFVSNVIICNKFNIYTYHMPMSCTLSILPIDKTAVQDSATVTNKYGRECWIHYEDSLEDKELRKVFERMFGI